MKKAAVIVAGGRGTRMGGPVSKQYLPIGGKPVLMHSLAVFQALDKDVFLVLVIPKDDFEFWDKLCAEYKFDINHIVVSGGSSRFQSVKNGLDSLPFSEGLVAIHDGVRPFVSPSVIQESFAVAEKKGSAIAVVPVKDSLRKLTDQGTSLCQDRQYFRLVQTPQTFQLQKIRKAFELSEIPQFTDDATVYEHQGWEVSLIPGNLENIKITTKEDLDYAEYILSKK